MVILLKAVDTRWQPFLKKTCPQRLPGVDILLPATVHLSLVYVFSTISGRSWSRGPRSSNFSRPWRHDCMSHAHSSVPETDLPTGIRSRQKICSEESHVACRTVVAVAVRPRGRVARREQRRVIHRQPLPRKPVHDCRRPQQVLLRARVVPPHVLRARPFHPAAIVHPAPHASCPLHHPVLAHVRNNFRALDDRSHFGAHACGVVRSLRLLVGR